MKKVAIAGMVVIAVLVGMPLVSANEGGNTSDTNESVDYDEVLLEVSDNIKLVDYEFHEDEEKVTLWFTSDEPENVTLTDAYIDPDANLEEINQQSIEIDGNTQVTFDITEVGNQMGVTFDAGEGLYPLTHQTSRISFSSTYRPFQVFLFLMGGSGLGVSLVMGVAMKKKMEYTSEIEKEL